MKIRLTVTVLQIIQKNLISRYSAMFRTMVSHNMVVIFI